MLDDELVRKLMLKVRTVLESVAVKEKHLRILVTLADNLANYARVIIQENPDKALEKIRELEG